MSGTPWVGRLFSKRDFGPRAQRRVLVAAGSLGSIALATHQLRRHAGPQDGTPSVLLPSAVAQMLTGGLAEAVSVTCFYPLDTLKVMCQQTGQSASSALRTLMLAHPGTAILPVLYNGSAAMAVASILIGSVYYAAFRQSTTLFEGLLGTASPAAVSADAVAAPASAASARGAAAVAAGDDVGRASAASAGRGASDAGGACGGGVSAARESPQWARTALAAVLAAVMASVVTAVLEGPTEYVRSRVQAGVVPMGMFDYVLRGGGLRASIPFLAPYLLKTIPFDVAELTTYSAISSLASARLARDGAVPTELMDAAFGAAAGAVAVIVSAPADCIKTRIMTMPSEVASLAVKPDVRALYTAAARSIVRSQGLAGLFVGTWPRLAERVPACMVYWVVIEACGRAIKPYTRPDGPAASSAASEAIASGTLA